jgi:microcystin-dependent protein
MIITNKTTSDIYFGPLHLGAGIGTTLTVDDTSATSLYLTSDAVADAINAAAQNGQITVSSEAQPFPRPTGEPKLLHGTGNPEGIVYAPQGSIYMRRDGADSNGGVVYSKTSGVTYATGWVDVATASGASVASPTGAIVAFGGATAPDGWLICDGSEVSRSQYSLLFAAIGTLYGAGDGSTTFNLPDLQGRIAAGWAESGGHADVSTLGGNDGTTTLADRRPRHKHSVVQPTISQPSITVSDPGHAHGISDPGHSHSYVVQTFTSGGATTIQVNTNVQTQTWGTSSSTTGISVSSHTTGISAALASAPVASGGTVGPQTGAEPTDAPAYLIVNHIIKT